MPAQKPVPIPFSFPELRVVEASAGSGKTYALAKRYVRLILHLSRGKETPPIHSILAITFTNKAAIEMKERILRFLKELALGVMDPGEREDMLEGLDMSSDGAQKTAQIVIDTILRNYNYFQVQTIDRFINALLVSSAFQIGLTANFRIKTSSRDHLALALDELIDEVATNVAVKRTFDDFLTSMLLVEARSAWIPKDVVLDTVQQLFGDYNTYAKAFSREGIKPEDLIRTKGQIIAQVKAFVEKMPEGVNKTFAQSMRRFAESHRGAFRFSPGLSSYFVAGKEIPWIKGAVRSSWHEDQWAKIQAGFVKAADLEVRHLYDPYVEIFESVREKLAENCIREDMLFLEELNAKARLVYEQGIAPEELYYRLSTRFEHYLFDEFQDTSILQWENLRVLPEDAIAKGGSLFYVGDKKQAIYSFRGGDTRLFDDVREQYKDPGYHSVRERLVKSRRSLKSIVEFNNKIFDLSCLEGLMRVTGKDGDLVIPARAQDFDELKRIYEGASQELVHLSPEGCVRVEILEGANKDDVRTSARAKVMPIIRDLAQRFSLRDIGILVRKNDDVEEVTRWLLEEGIPSSSERTLNIKEHVLVGEVIAFLRFLCSPIDNVSFAEFIHGGIFLRASGLSIEDIQGFILSWRMPKQRASLYMAFRQKFPKEWEAIVGDFFKNAGLYPFYETLVSFYRRTQVLENFPGDQGFLMHLLDLVKTKEEEFPDMLSFLDHYDVLEGEDLYVDVAGGDAVQIMTVHKAKGLEFRAVVLPFLTMSLDRKSSARNKALAYTLCPGDDDLMLYHFNKTHTKYSELAEELDVDEDMRTFFSELNNIYVALTRAACEMYVFIPPKAGQSRNLVRDLIPESLYGLGEPATRYPEKKSDEAGDPKELLPSGCLDWITFLREEFSLDNDLARRKERDAGRTLHAILERVKVLQDKTALVSVRDAVVAAGEQRRLPFSTEEGVSQVAEFVSSPLIRPFFFTNAQEIYCEREFADRFGNARRMDRVLVFDKEVWVVDFKLDVLGDEAQVQVRGYMNVLQDVFLGKHIKGFLVSIIEKKVKEIV
ncbi:MAG: UvrD-helicase domain-containing protein [Candidatus Omnitrophica bacterium]|nr:UvrD-helicase domain-containing protein [Candidatus Omnitrophota bacterium]